MKDSTILVIIIIVLTLAYFFYRKPTSSGGQDYSIPSGYTGSQGLDYIKKNYGSELAQAQSLCVGQFKGNWINTANEIGCENMQGFSSAYCSFDVIQNLENLCNSIGGNAVCSSTQTTCTV